MLLDCTVTSATIPPEKKGGRTKPGIEYELLTNNPYTYTQEELLYEVYVLHKLIPENELSTRGTQIRNEFFQKPQPCLRASMLPKKYGWGIHFNTEGKIALVPIESHEYWQFMDNVKEGVKLLAAMRNKRKPQ